MSDRSKFLDVVLKLNRLTQDGEIEWEREPLHSFYPEEEGGVKIVPAVREEYATTQKGKRFVLYQVPDRTESGIIGQLPKRAELEIRDPDSGETLFTFPPIAAIDDLYDSVSNTEPEEIDAFLDEFLSEE